MHTHTHKHARHGPAMLTVLQGFGDHLLRGRTSPGPVSRLDNHAVLCELLQVVQHNALHCVSCGVHADDGELVASTGAVLPVAHLVASDHAVLQVLVGRLPWTRNNQSPYEETIDE